jgi:hypothetical protein
LIRPTGEDAPPNLPPLICNFARKEISILLALSANSGDQYLFKLKEKSYCFSDAFWANAMRTGTIREDFSENGNVTTGTIKMSQEQAFHE